MPIRNPFRRIGGGADVQDESRSRSDRGFENTAVTGSRPVDVKEPAEYKLSEINDSGVYLPPSPPEKPSFWHSRSNNSTSSNHRSLLNENEPFSISRESFDSYRRSFDISARSPIPDTRQSFDVHTRSRASMDTYARPGRQSLDIYSRPRGAPTNQPSGRASLNIPRPFHGSSGSNGNTPTSPGTPTVDESFEDVGLDEEPKPQQKKKGLLARLGVDGDDRDGHGFHFGVGGGRKRGGSGQGNELRSMPAQQEIESR